MKLLFFSLLLLFASPILADDTSTSESSEPEVPPHILTNMPEPLKDVFTSVYFPPAAADGKFHPGDVIDALIAISNEATEALKITTIAGALTSPINRLMYYQNFTEFPYNITLQPREEWTVHYKFQADPRIEARPFGLVLAVFYSAIETGKNYSSTVYNSTFEFSDFPDKIDAKRFFTYLGLIATSIILVVFGYKPVKDMLSATHKRRRQASTGDKDEKSEEDAWLQNTAAATPRRSASRSKSRSPQRRAVTPADH